MIQMLSPGKKSFTCPRYQNFSALSTILCAKKMNQTFIIMIKVYICPFK